ncbi:MAG: ABC transporter ATP-binding protein [Dehalococcoidales bacterium]|jgi:lipopolysaccharide transport system ATP-binding protein
MPGTVISVENLSKSYRLGVIGTGTFRGDIHRWWAKQRGKPDPYQIIGQADHGNRQGETLWALKDVSFQVQQGEALGIIGRNGAGKSTLLKILSQVTAPTSGIVKVKGRIASLLEVGTGFHPELTGRENIYLNGAIMGMSRAEVANKFDEIVDFSGVDQFIDTPVKRYSSGMYVRLAFAVAAHLEPEILVVDEVLAVGDADFQKKCLGKMSDVASEGRTVLFVSHNMGAVEQLCSSGILLEQGKIKLFSNRIKDVVRDYLRPESTITSSIWENKENKYYSEYFSLNKLYLTDEDGNILPSVVDNSKDIFINFDFEIDILDLALEITYEVYDDEFRLVYCSQHTDASEEKWPKIKKGQNILRTKIPKHFLNEGLYHIKPGACLYKRISLLEPTKHNISVILNIVGGLSDSPYWYSRRAGIIAPIFEWSKIK